MTTDAIQVFYAPLVFVLDYLPDGVGTALESYMMWGYALGGGT